MAERSVTTIPHNGAMCPAMNRFPPREDEWNQMRLKDIGCNEQTKLPDGFSGQVVTGLGGHLGNLNIACLAGFLLKHGVLNQNSFQKITEQATTDLLRENALLSELMRLVKLPCYQNKLPGLLYLACLDSFEKDPGQLGHYHFAMAILRPQILKASQIQDNFDPKMCLNGIEDSNLPEEIANELKGYLNLAGIKSVGLRQIITQYFASCLQSDSTSISHVIEALLCTPTLGRKLSGLFPYAQCNGPDVYKFFFKAVAAYWVLFAKHCGYTEIEKNKIMKSAPHFFTSQITVFLRCFWIPSVLLEDTYSTLGKVCRRIRIPEITELPFQGHSRIVNQIQHRGLMAPLLFSVQPQPLEFNSSSAGPIIEEFEEPLPSSAQCQSLTINSSSTSPIIQEYVESDEGPARQDKPMDEMYPQVNKPTKFINLCIADKWDDVRRLLEVSPTAIDAPNPQDGKTALMYAALAGKNSIVSLLLDNGADPNVVDKDGKCCLHFPKVLRNIDMLTHLGQIFIERNIPIDYEIIDDGTTPLMVAAKCNAVEAVRYLLGEGASPDGSAKEHKHPLIEASSHGYDKVVKLLLKHGANPDCQDENGNTPLLVAIHCRQMSVFSLLLDNNANPNKSDKAGTTPLFASIEIRSIEIVLNLLQKGAHVNTIRQQGKEAVGFREETPLALAAGIGNPEILQALISHDADVNRVCSGIIPPIAFAVYCNQKETFDLLLESEKLNKSIDGLRHVIISSVQNGKLYFAKRLIDVLGGAENLLREATSREMNMLAQTICVFKDSGGEDVTALEDVGVNSHISESHRQCNLKAEEILHKFCQICQDALLSQTRKSPAEIVLEAKNFGYEQIANHLNRIFSNNVRHEDLKVELLQGRPSPFLFLVQSRNLTIEDFQTTVFMTFGDVAGDFCQQLLETFSGMPGGQELPNNAANMLNLLFSGGFCPGVSRRRVGGTGFPEYVDDESSWHGITESVVPQVASPPYHQPDQSQQLTCASQISQLVTPEPEWQIPPPQFMQQEMSMLQCSQQQQTLQSQVSQQQMPQTQVVQLQMPQTQVLQQQTPHTQVLQLQMPQTQVLQQQTPQSQVLQQQTPQTQILQQQTPQTQVLQQQTPQTQSQLTPPSPRQQTFVSKLPQPTPRSYKQKALQSPRQHQPPRPYGGHIPKSHNQQWSPSQKKPLQLPLANSLNKVSQSPMQHLPQAVKCGSARLKKGGEQNVAQGPSDLSTKRGPSARQPTPPPSGKKAKKSNRLNRQHLPQAGKCGSTQLKIVGHRNVAQRPSDLITKRSSTIQPVTPLSARNAKDKKDAIAQHPRSTCPQPNHSSLQNDEATNHQYLPDTNGAHSSTVTSPSPTSEVSDDHSTCSSPPENLGQGLKGRSVAFLDQRYQRSASSPSPSRHPPHPRVTHSHTSVPIDMPSLSEQTTPQQQLVPATSVGTGVPSLSIPTPTSMHHNEAQFGDVGAETDSSAHESFHSRPFNRPTYSRRSLPGMESHIDLEAKRVMDMLEELSEHGKKDWRDIGIRLGFVPAELDSIDGKYHYQIEKCYQILFHWIKKKSASYKELLNAFIKMERYDMCKIVKCARVDIYECK